MTFNIPHNVPIPTSPVDKPYRVQLEREPAEEGGIVTVYDHVVIDGRRIVRSAHGAGFWHLPAALPTVPAGLDMTGAVGAAATTVPIATFEPHLSVSFVFPRR
jgi:hypothetical protein